MDVVIAAVLAFLGAQRTCLGALGIFAILPHAARNAGSATRATVVRSGVNILAGVCFVLGAVAVAAHALNSGTVFVFAAAVLLAVKGIAEFLVRARAAVRA
jgi:hypothetical protein